MSASATVLDAVRELAPSIRERAAEFEAERSMPVDLFEELKAAGVWRMLTPRAYGGLEVGLAASLEVLETLAQADGSTAWTAMIGVESPQLLALLPRHAFEELYADGPDVTIGGAITPAGEAAVVDGGYRIHGRWPFASGCQRWDLLMATCVVFEDGQPRTGPAGEPAPLAMVLPAEEVTIEDTWRTLGMRATGSHHLVIEDAFVPEDRTLSFFFGTPSVDGVSRFPIIDFHFHLAVIALGIARGALAATVDAAKSRQRMAMRSTLAKTALAQHRLGRAEVALRAARAFLYAEAGRAARVMADGSEDFLTLAVRVWANHAWLAELCTDVVGTCFSLNGASGVYDGSYLQRCLRDIYTLRQHASLNESSLTRAGAALLGEPVDMTLG